MSSMHNCEFSMHSYIYDGRVSIWVAYWDACWATSTLEGRYTQASPTRNLRSLRVDENASILLPHEADPDQMIW